MNCGTKKIEKAVEYLMEKKVTFDDFILFDHIVNLKSFLAEKENEPQFFKQNASEKIVDFFSANSNIN